MEGKIFQKEKKKNSLSQKTQAFVFYSHFKAFLWCLDAVKKKKGNECQSLH